MRTTHASGTVLLKSPAGDKHVPFALTDDGIVRWAKKAKGSFGKAIPNIDPTLPIFFTRGSVDSARSEGGLGSHPRHAEVLAAGGFRLKGRTLAEHIAHMSQWQDDPDTIARDLIIAVVSQYGEKYQKAKAEGRI